ncbi:MAG: oligosaccharyl transferase stt3 subunit [Chaenotheca gracillima]|nr:MAG: oligosaccharyl transferase stt3 subunit [Chaenotheca gracillima]
MARRYDVPGALPPLSTTQLSQMYATSDSKNSIGLVDTLAEYESDATILSLDRALSTHQEIFSLFYTGYLFALLLIDDLNEARFLTHRLPRILADQVPAIRDSIDVLHAVWSRDYVLIYSSLKKSSWPVELQPLVDRYLEHFRLSTFQLLSKAYTTLPPSLAAAYLGLEGSDSQIAEQLTARGWRIDETGTVLRPCLTDALAASTARRQIMSGGSRDTATLVDLIGFLGEQNASAQA